MCGNLCRKQHVLTVSETDDKKPGAQRHFV